VVADQPPLHPRALYGAKGATTEMIKVSKRVLTRALRHASTDSTRPTLYGVLLERDEKGARAVATDGHRLIVIEYDEVGEELRSLPLPSESALAPVWLLEAAKSAFFDRDFYYVGDGRIEPADETDLTVKSISYVSETVTFPAWRQIVGSSSGAAVLSLDLKVLKAALDRSATAIFRFVGNAVHCTQRDDTTDTDLGVVGEIKSGKAPCEQIGFNGRYVWDALRSMSGHVTCDVFGEMEPAVFRGTVEGQGIKSVTVLVMPMRV
jgi:DNA polymerase III sliding clamp (beta) subunit (PCNA family)